MTAASICAVVVTYHPTAEMVDNLSGIFAQAGSLVVVDNGSGPDALNALRAASQNRGFHLIENGDNLGIAAALNLGVRWAVAQGYPWVVLFDQDSKIPGDFLTTMLETLRRHPQRDRVASLHPAYVDPVTGHEGIPLRAKDGGPIKSLTSGALMPAWIFDKIGMFAAEYFIDEVDTEYCLRIRAAGYLVADSRESVLKHSAGHPRPISILGFTFRPTYHSAVRRYYISRNRIAVCRKYFLKFPYWTARLLFGWTRETVKCFLAEKDRARKFHGFLLGAWDGIIGKMGRNDRLGWR